MNKLLFCRYNMDTKRMEARFKGSTTCHLAVTMEEWKID